MSSGFVDYHLGNKGDVEGFLKGEDSFLSNPAGYLFFHKDAPYTNPYIKQLISMSQQNWDYFDQNIRPVQQSLLESAMGNKSINEAVGNAREGVQQQFANVPAAFNREMQSRGISVSPDQQAAFKKESGLQEGIAEVGASNRARQTTYAQQRSILLGG